MRFYCILKIRTRPFIFKKCDCFVICIFFRHFSCAIECHSNGSMNSRCRSPFGPTRRWKRTNSSELLTSNSRNLIWHENAPRGTSYRRCTFWIHHRWRHCRVKSFAMYFFDRRTLFSIATVFLSLFVTKLPQLLISMRVFIEYSYAVIWICMWCEYACSCFMNNYEWAVFRGIISDHLRPMSFQLFVSTKIKWVGRNNGY